MRKVRFTIGGFMAVVLVLAIGFAAVRNSDPTWSGMLAMLTYGSLGVAILGMVLRRGAERAWWIGYFVFGCGYMRMMSWAFSHLAKPPTLLLLEWVRGKAGSPPAAADPFAAENLVLLQIDRCLWAFPACAPRRAPGAGLLRFDTRSCRALPSPPCPRRPDRPGSGRSRRSSSGSWAWS